MLRQRAGLWTHPDFMKLWIGQTISEFGSRITREALPLTAVMILAATPAQMGWLTAISSVPVLVFGLIAGVWVDRLRRRPIMIAADAGRLLLLLTIPLATLTGHLSLELLLFVAALTSILSLFFDVAYRSFLPSLVMRENVLEGNAKLATTDALAEVGGPAVTGVLVQLFGAPLAIFFDAVSFLFSAVSFVLIRAPEPPPVERGAYQSLWRDIVEGVHVMRDIPALRTLALALGLRSFFGNFYGVLYSLYVVRDLGLSPAILGFLIAGGGIGALVGALLAERLPRRFGLGRALTGALVVSAVIGLLIPLSGGVPVLLAVVMLLAGQIIGDAAMMVYGVNEMSLRQMLVPERALGRVNASFGFLAEGVAPLGALVAGALAMTFSTRGTLWVAALGILLVALWVFVSPVRHLRGNTN